MLSNVYIIPNIIPNYPVELGTLVHFDENGVYADTGRQATLYHSRLLCVLIMGSPLRPVKISA